MDTAFGGVLSRADGVRLRVLEALSAVLADIRLSSRSKGDVTSDVEPLTILPLGLAPLGEDRAAEGVVGLLPDGRGSDGETAATATGELPIINTNIVIQIISYRLVT